MVGGGRRFLLICAVFGSSSTRTGGWHLVFLSSSLARLSSCRFSLSRICVARIVSVSRNVVERAWRGAICRRRVGRRDLASRPSVPFYDPVDFLISACGRILCAVFVSSFSCVIC